MTSPEREKLPNRRAHELVNFEHDGFRYVAGVGRFNDDSVAEIFINAAKTGTTLESIARDAAILASICLQYGASVDTLRHALTRNGDSSASGVLGTLLDLLATQKRAS
ncbi:MAG: hypothetical protein WA425_17670 [Xanthobacteraceae bacterium]